MGPSAGMGFLHNPTNLCHRIGRHGRRLTVLVFCVLLAGMLAGCESASVATPTPTTITIAGATAMRRVLQDLTTEFSRLHPNVLFVVRGGGSTIGEETIRQHEVDLGASTLMPPELEKGAPAPPDEAALQRVPIGIDGLAVIVHPSNPITGLSFVQLRDLYSGNVLDWQALGSEAGEVLLVSREDGSGARILFETRVMGAEHVSLTAVVMPSSKDVVEYVSKNPQAIGYVSRSEVAEWIAEGEADQTATPTPPAGIATPGAPRKVKVLAVEGRLPTRENVRSLQYGLTQPLFLISNGKPTGWVRQFIDYVLSPAGQTIVARYHAPVR